MNTTTKNKIIALSTVVFILLVLGYLITNIIQAVFYKGTYTIDFREENFLNPKKALYINEEVDSYKFASFGQTNSGYYAKLNKTPISFIFQPEEFPIGKEIEFSATIQTEDDWDISLICPKCKEKYDWQPFYNHKLDNTYILAAKYDEIYIYASENAEWKIADNFEYWMKRNIKQGSSLELAENIYLKSKLKNNAIGYKKNSWTEINKTLRGEHDFFIYLDDELILEIEKEDLNWYIGMDGVKIVLKDLDNNIVFDDEIIDDDGIIEETSKATKTISKRINKTIPKNGIYKLQFIENNEAKADWTIKKFKINTNKIVFAEEKNLILDKTEIYTEIPSEKEIYFYIWHQDAKQDLTIIPQEYNKEEQIISLGEDSLGKWVNTKVTKGEYIIKTKGDQKIKGFNFALTKENYFEPFKYDLTTTQNPSFIITNYYFLENNNWKKMTKKIKAEDLKKLKNLKKIEIQINNEKQNSEYNKTVKLLENNFSPISTFNQYELFGKEVLEDLKNAYSLSEWINSNIPSNSSLYIMTDTAINTELINKDINLEYDYQADFVIKNKNSNNHNFIKDIEVIIK